MTFFPSRVSPRIGVISDPAYVVGATISGQVGSQRDGLRETRRGPATHRNESVDAIARDNRHRSVRNIDGGVHARAGKYTGATGAYLFGKQAGIGLLSRSRHDQYAGKAKPLDLSGKAVERPAPKMTRPGLAL